MSNSAKEIGINEKNKPVSHSAMDNASLGFFETGVIQSIADGIALVRGLEYATAGEMLEIQNSRTTEVFMGMVLNLNLDTVGAVVFASERDISAGDRVFRTKTKVTVPVGLDLLGRVLDALGNPIDGEQPIRDMAYRPV